MKRKTLTAITLIMVAIACLSGVSTKLTQAAGTQADLIATAASQVGYKEKASSAYLDDYTVNAGAANYTKYARDLGVGNGQPWCAYFVWWCMQTSGVDSNNYPRVGYATRDWFRNRGLWRDRGSYTPKAGDYIAFGNSPDHCGIVESVSGSTVNTIEGNSGDMVCRHSYSLGNSYIMGYGIINYTGTSVQPLPVDNSNPGAPYPIPSGILRPGSTGDSVKWIQECVNQLLGAGIAVDGIYGNDTTYAVRVYQQRHNLEADGIVGTNTTNSMLAVWREEKKPKDTTPPVISNARIVSQTEDSYTVQCTVTDNVGVTSVKFPTWTNANWQDDIIWYEGTRSGNTATITINRNRHNNEYGTYNTHIYAYDAAGNQVGPSILAVELEKKAVPISVPTATPTAKPTAEPTKSLVVTAGPTVVSTAKPTEKPGIIDKNNISDYINHIISDWAPRNNSDTQEEMDDTEGNYKEEDEEVRIATPKKLKAAGKSGKVVVKWKAIAECDGYELRYSTSKKFTSGVKRIKINDCTKTSVKLKKCKLGKAYYVKVRAYKLVDGEKEYGDYSKKLKISKQKIKIILKR